jgi:hypothetical protein
MALGSEQYCTDWGADGGRELNLVEADEYAEERWPVSKRLILAYWRALIH